MVGLVRVEDWRWREGARPLVMECEGCGCVAGGASSVPESLLVSDIASSAPRMSLGDAVSAARIAPAPVTVSAGVGEGRG